MKIKENQFLNSYKIVFPNGIVIHTRAYSGLEVIRKYDLCTRENTLAVLSETYHNELNDVR